MEYLHQDFHLASGDVVEVELDRQANVRLLNDANYRSFRRGQQHRYYGGLVKVSPFRLRAPRAGHWHLVIDLGGYPAKPRTCVRVLKG